VSGVTEITSGRTAHDKGVPHVEFFVPAALHTGGDVGFGQAAQGVAVMFFAVGMAHSHGAGHAAGLVDDVDIDAQEFGHFGVMMRLQVSVPPPAPQTTTAVILRLGNPFAAMASSSSLVNDL
jgi:hypothetical protein